MWLAVSPFEMLSTSCWRDVRTVYGPDAVRVALMGDPAATEQLASENPALLDSITGPWSSRADFDGTDFWVYIPGEGGGTGSRIPDGEPFAEAVERIADRVQETVAESRAHFGDAFPPCPRHGSHPMWPEVQNRRAVWVCHSERTFMVPIGELDRRSEEP